MPKTLSKKQSKKKTPQPKKRSSPASTTKLFPGYVGFSAEVLTLIRTHRMLFLRLLLLASLSFLLISGISQYTQYAEFSGATEEVSSQLTTGFFKTLVEIGALFISVVTGSLTSSLSESQQIYTGIVYGFLWLVTVWLVRHLSSGAEVRLRDSLYNAGAPVLSTLIVIGIGLLQLLPIALLVALFSLLTTSGIISGGIVLAVGVTLIFALTGLTLYWLISTIFAAIVVTIPGTYPGVALESARQLVSGLRLQILLRLLWLGLVSMIVFLVTIVPLIALDAVLGYNVPFIVVLAVVLVSTALCIYAATYLYLLYRKVIDERS